jgi:hypothetical protein
MRERPLCCREAPYHSAPKAQWMLAPRFSVGRGADARRESRRDGAARYSLRNPFTAFIHIAG